MDADHDRGPHRYRCITERCPARTVFADRLAVEPLVRAGELVCPLCAHPVELVAPAGPTRSLTLRANGRRVAGLVVEVGLPLVLGRWGGDGAVPLDDLLGADAAAVISRRHVRFDLAELGLFATDLGSANGSWLRFGPSRLRLPADACVLVPPGGTIELAREVEVTVDEGSASQARLPRSTADLTADATRLAAGGSDHPTTVRPR